MLHQEEPAKPQRPANFPTEIYAGADKQSSLYQLDSSLSTVRIKVLRGGLMAKLGHDHIVASRDIQGYLLLGSNSAERSCRADFYAPINQLIVDDPTLRAEANLSTTPSANDIAGTKTNMLISLQADQFPFLQLHSVDCAGALNEEPVSTTISLHGVSREQLLQMTVTRPDAESLVISGRFAIVQSDFGIEPFSVFNGLLKVEDRLDISYQIVARKKD